jgi:Tfp pilus assembly protein PilP
MPANAATSPTPTALAPATNAPAPNAPVVSSPAAVASAPTTTLVGILDIGDRSSAMFEMNGSVQSVLVGDRVTGSSWVLNRITQQEAILKRGNEIKTLYVGQKF